MFKLRCLLYWDRSKTNTQAIFSSHSYISNCLIIKVFNWRVHMPSTKAKLFCSVAASVKFIQDNIQRFLSHLLYKSSSNPTFKKTHKILHINKYSTCIIYKLLWLKMLNCQEVWLQLVWFFFSIYILKKKKKKKRMLKQLRLVWLRVNVWVRSLQGKLKCWMNTTLW